MEKTNKDKPTISKDQLEEIKNNKTLFKKLVRIAQYESELDLGVNPQSIEQATVAYLTERDFEYIKRVCEKAKLRLENPQWIADTIDNIENKSVLKRRTARGIKFDDELFKVGRGILENYIKENSAEENNKN